MLAMRPIRLDGVIRLLLFIAALSNYNKFGYIQIVCIIHIIAVSKTIIYETLFDTRAASTEIVQ